MKKLLLIPFLTLSLVACGSSAYYAFNTTSSAFTAACRHSSIKAAINYEGDSITLTATCDRYK